MTTREPSGASTSDLTVAVAVEFVGLTLALVDGFHDCKAPADEYAAKCLCETPLAVVNAPPT